MEARLEYLRKYPLHYGEITDMVRKAIDDESVVWLMTLSDAAAAKRARTALYQAARRQGVAVNTRVTTNTDGTSDVLWSLRKEVGE